MALSIKKELFPQQFSINIRVLVIDHDINLLNAIQNVCYKFNYSVKSCLKVSDALNLLKENKDSFNLVLIEARMPDMDSYGFLQYVTQQINIPVIMMSRDDSKNAVMEAIEDGACDYWIKPFTEDLMMNMWQHVARKIWNENKNLELKAEVGMKKGMIYNSTPVFNTSEKQESVEKNNDKSDSSTKKTRVTWSSELNKKFIRAVVELNIDKATPNKILAKMNEPGLTRDHVASRLQKYRLNLKREETKKQRKQNSTIEATESKFSNGSSEFDFQAYDASTSHVVPNNFIPPESKNIAYATHEEEISSTSINEFKIWTNSIINAQVQNFYLTCQHPHQIPTTQPLPTIIENPISSRGISPFCAADTVGDIGGTNNSNGILRKIKSHESLESFHSCHSSWSAEDN